jgi:peptidoglycan/xylan/chitin deacetylase (PgdA/CDA1 family)
MPAAGHWPGGARAAVCVTFDNLGEAAEQQMGLETPSGGHYSVTTALPIVLTELEEAGITATFFVEGINAETYPEALCAIAGAGHEVAFHAWRHEDWGRLSQAEEEENLRRGLGALRARGLEPAGFRPPGGGISDRTPELLVAEGLSYCSPAGEGVGSGPPVLLPFAWRHVDAYHLLPQFGALRDHFDGSEEPGGPERVEERMTKAIDDAIAAGGQVTLVLHNWLIEAERDQVRAVLTRVHRAAADGEVWAARCDEVAGWVRDHASEVATGATLDTTSWMDPG